ncbi:acetyl-coenzyme-A carboxylase [Coemansia spiralis]|uniref:Acetyl-coenzyme-A carboxylase n=2 Tax=Coemansia TaxID=4863 RepID=A0A9W8KY47_9FUNG|nr:acetyl-coenzyme-A carboxylase [Coemansia umbellata]KAJ2621220.1 acetyl-coenzyme-A carboxylase [Coemansia sp. RSA 1358]KAJ2676767.1 acetyl-coenzyme-A carboxylase [Coemansia spiralis]
MPRKIGGNSVDVATNNKVRDYVKDHGGHTVITRVLIANNGIAAVKEIRSVRQWAYATFGDERAIEFVVMATPEDLKVNAEYIRMADQYVEVPGGTNNNNYANVELIVDVAERTGAHAVWAGWGHASENPLLPESLRASKSKVVFIGPPGSAMRSLGDKISSTIVAQHAEVPTMPWSGDGIKDTMLNDQGFLEVPDDAYHAATTHNMEEGLKQAIRIGFPVMIKASEGGGGKGIRMVAKEADFASAFYQCQAEVPGSPIFIMKLAGESRHLEVQVLADQYGNAISLFGRDCSVQRRHQKIIEEAPVTIAKQDTFEQMEKAAVRLAKLVGYVSAGTVEYLYTPANDKFYFLELNPRLQVEHPTTEMVSGVNLPAAQLLVAMGIPLHNIREIRLLYGLDPKGTSPIDFEFASPQSNDVQRKPQPKGHVIAVRITAENPEAGFKPSSGMMQSLNFRSSTNVWGYFSVSANGGLHEFADSQFGHIFAYGGNREQARQAMVVALKEISIRGDFRTTVEYLVRLLEMPDFKSNMFTTAWLDRLISAHLTAERPDPELAVICGAATMAQAESVKLLAEFKSAMDRGQAPNKALLKTTFQIEFIYESVRYRFIANRTGPTGWVLYLNGSKVAVGVRSLSDGGVLILFDGKSHTCYSTFEVGATRLLVDERTCLLEEEVDPTQLRSPSPGKLVRFLVDSGDHVKSGEAYAEIEVMKMYMQLTTTEDGVVQFVKQPGASLAAGEVIGVLTLDDPSRVKHAKPFEGQLAVYGPPQAYGSKTHQLLRRNLTLLTNALDGYDTPVPANQLLQQISELLQKPDLPFLEIGEVLSALHSRLPPKLTSALGSELSKAQQFNSGFPAKEMLAILNSFLGDIAPADAATLTATVAPIKSVLENYKDGLAVHERNIFVSLLQRYIDAEEIFSNTDNEEEGFFALRDKYRSQPELIVETMISHAGVATKNKIIMSMLDVIHPVNSQSGSLDSKYEDVLKNLTTLSGRATAKVALKAREILLQCQVPSLEERKRQMEHILRSSITETVYGSGEEHRTPSYDAIKDLIVTNYYVFDVLQSFLYHSNPYIRLAALEVYVRRAYHMYNLVDFDYETDESAPFMVHWRFILQDDSSGMFAGHIGKNSSVSDLKRIMSVSDLNFAVDKDADPEQYLRQGAMAAFDTFKQMEDNFLHLLGLITVNGTEANSRAESPALGMRSLNKFAPMSALNGGDPTHRSSGTSTPSRNPRYGHVINVALQVPHDDPFDDDTWSSKLQDFTAGYATELRENGIRRLTFVLQRSGQHPGTFTYRENIDFNEDKTIRHIEPGLAYQLELPRLSNFDIRPCFNDNRQLHIYHGISKQNSADSRFFVRVLVRPGRLSTSVATVDYLISETDRLLNDILDALEILSVEYPNTDCNHLFISFLPIFNLDSSQFEPAYRGFLERHGKRLFRLRVTAAEIRFLVQTGSEEDMPTPFRFCIFNKSGFVPKLENYIEIRDENGEWVFQSLDSPPGSYNGMLVSTPHQPKEWLQPRRYKAHIMGTTYVYDFPDLFYQAVSVQWARIAKLASTRSAATPPRQLLEAKELVWDEATQTLAESDREAGRNTCGMVAWVLTMYTPEAPKGRKIVVIANDITFKIGSFGVEEDVLFYRATQYAREHGYPRVYLSANSGARIGLAEEIRELFRPCWRDESDPEQGFEYLYLNEEEYAKLEAREEGKVRSVITEPITMPNGEVRHKLLTIVGISEGLGVENLRGSGMIAGETSRAYNDIFTVTLVTCRSVGIGAYLVRLGQRSIQNEGQPIILTGAPALNKILGREVYTSNLQLGGTQVMYKNGVSHLTAENDFMGICKIVRWLSFVPTVRDAPLLPVSSVMQIDPVERIIAYEPPAGPSDPRLFLAGADTENGWLSGFFDRGSYVETLGGWARTVVTGRARLGGIPMGVIAVEGRTVENIIPADPANPNSEEQVLQEAGTVWYPNSAYKTAQAIQDFNNGEQLPLMIFANWRGFSGGQRDMYFEVLKYGAYIVDALSKYKQPVFVYIVPNGELRGGAWVVVDPTINSDMMEMYADKKSRGSVIEPEGIVEIKFRKPQMLACMDRLDIKIREMRQALGNPDLAPAQKAEIKEALDAREKALLPIYKQMAVHFADLHDRAGRMVAKGVIRKELQWENTRTYFFYRLKRRLFEEELRKTMQKVSPELTRDQSTVIIGEWFAKANSDADFAYDDKVVVAWFEDASQDIAEKLNTWAAKIEADKVATQVAQASDDDIVAALQKLSPERREQLLSKLQ